jgi:acetate kinase
MTCDHGLLVGRDDSHIDVASRRADARRVGGVGGRVDSNAEPTQRVVAAHLGAGASLYALQNGVSIATTMSFSVLDGLVMSTRCGAIDPGVLLYPARQGKIFEEIEDLLY